MLNVLLCHLYRNAWILTNTVIKPLKNMFEYWLLGVSAVQRESFPDDSQLLIYCHRAPDSRKIVVFLFVLFVHH